MVEHSPEERGVDSSILSWATSNFIPFSELNNINGPARPKRVARRRVLGHQLIPIYLFEINNNIPTIEFNTATPRIVHPEVVSPRSTNVLPNIANTIGKGSSVPTHTYLSHYLWYSFSVRQSTKKMKEDISDIEAEVKLLKAVFRDMRALSRERSTEQESEAIENISTKIQKQ